jgi:phage tail tape-measure protein
MSGEDEAENAGRTAGVVAGMLGGAELGSKVIPVTYVGPVVGAVVGAAVGSEVGKRLGAGARRGRVGVFQDAHFLSLKASEQARAERALGRMAPAKSARLRQIATIAEPSVPGRDMISSARPEGRRARR